MSPPDTAGRSAPLTIDVYGGEKEVFLNLAKNKGNMLPNISNYVILGQTMEDKQTGWQTLDRLLQFLKDRG